MSEQYEHVPIADRAQWRAWLTEHHATSPGAWVVTWKQGHGQHLPYDALVEEALCFGWIDSRPGSVDADRSRRLLTPRRAGSSWSRLNKTRVQSLTDAGLMSDAGLAAVAVAQRDGTLDRAGRRRGPRRARRPPRCAGRRTGRAPALGPVPALDPAGDPRMDRHRQDPTDPRETDRHRRR